MRHKELNATKLTILQLLNLTVVVLREEGLEDTTHLPLQRRMGADVLEETGLVVDPQLLLLLLALLVVLVQLAHLGPHIKSSTSYTSYMLYLIFWISYIKWIKLAHLCLDQVLQQPIHWRKINIIR